MTRLAELLTSRRCHLVGAVLLLAAADITGLPPLPMTGEAKAWVGQPWTPRSAAGVARRTTVRRSAIYLNTLPPACARVVINGMSLWSCAGRYYQRHGGRYVVVYVR